MYHFTDVPMLISNESFVVLDPQQQVLPMDYKTRRKRRVGMRMPFSKVNRLAPDQLDPFVGLRDFDRDADQYQGTMFRFPLRALGARTSLKESHQAVDSALVKALLDKYLATARMSLLFLRHVKSIEFHIRGRSSPQWIVSADHLPDPEINTFKHIEVTTSQTSFEQRADTWCVGSEMVTQIPTSIQRSGRGSGKSTECGVAACLTEGPIRKTEPKEDVLSADQTLGTVAESVKQPKIQQTVFCRLPTTHKSSLPISFHASFAVTGDRRNIALETSAENSEWNRWLLNDHIAKLYLDTVQYLAPRLGQKAFDFWPVEENTTTLSGSLGQAFWEKLSSHHQDLDTLLPLVAQANESENGNGANLPASTYNTTSLMAAKLDFLSRPISDTLRSLLTRMTPHLVRPPMRLWSAFRSPALHPQTGEVNLEYLSEMFKMEENSMLLESTIAQATDDSGQCRIIESLLKTMIPNVGGEDTAILSSLNACRIVPRPCLSDRMGILVWNPGPDTRWHFLATPTEEKLFAFAAESMVHAGLFKRPAGALAPTSATNHDPIKILLSSQFNVRRLQLSDIGPLLARRSSPTRSVANTQDLDSWILELWGYLNRQFRVVYDVAAHSVPFFDETTEKLLQKGGLQDQKIYRIPSGLRCVYITPREFEDGPYVIKPLDEQHQKICEDIPGLTMIERNCAPFLLQEQERDLQCGESFRRLLRAFERLENKTSTTAKAIVGKALSSESRDIMKDLVIKYLEPVIHEGYKDIALIRRLPIWRRLQRSSVLPYDHIAADDALFCGHEKILMPWVKQRSRFVDPELVQGYKNALSKLDVSLMTLETTWDVIKADLPGDIKSKGSAEQYSEFVDYISRCGIKVAGRLAPNGALVMCEANTLYDDQEPIFKAAFREQKLTNFLHPKMQASSLHRFWLELGLRARVSGEIKHEHFHQCALAISRRRDPAFTSPDFVEDSQKVASYLKFDGDHFRSWPNSTWVHLATVPMFKVRDVAADEGSHRVTRMQQITRQRTHRSLEDSSNISWKRIVWSQRAFLHDQPGQFVYERFSRGGKPTATRVFDHLQFLITSIKNILQGELPEYLRDVQACYEYLQNELEATKLLAGVQTARIWLNLNTTQVELASIDQLDENLTSAKQLCLNSPVDPLPKKNARNFLIPYEKLLQGLDCKTVVQPSPASLPQSSDSRELSLAAAMGEMRQLRDQNQLVDVYFEAEGQKKPAHKIVLAAVSEYCKKQFADHWGRLLQNQATVRIEDLHFLTLSQMIDFAYTGDFEWPELKNPDDTVEIGDNLAMLLDLLDGTDRWLLQRLHDMTENFLTSPPYSGIYVRVDTVEWVKERAESSRAVKLVGYCEAFLKSNEEFVLAMRDDK